MLFAQKGPWKTVSVDLGEGTIQVPVFDRSGTRPGPTLLVTAGLDGDEYTGIEAAYALGASFKDKLFSGRLIILPCVNVPGFFTEVSLNPLDGQFPKSAGTGRAYGSPSERLIDWVVSSFAKNATMWMDLHSGALTEKLHPFLWAWPSGNQTIDARLETFFASLQNDTIVLDQGYPEAKIQPLARYGCGYLLSESGGRGNRLKEHIDLHLERTMRLMQSIGMINEGHAMQSQARILHKIAYLQAPYDGIWRPHPLTDSLLKNDEIGVCLSLDGTKQKTLLSPASGSVLWNKETMAMRKGDVLLAVAW